MIKVQNLYRLLLATSTIFTLVLILFSCSKETGEQDSPPPMESTPLEIISSVELEIMEPSGLSFAWNIDEFLVVSDHSNTVFRIHKDGSIIEELAFVGDDLEGVSWQEAGKILWVVEERLKKLVKLNKYGVLQHEYDLDYSSVSSNKGLEGIAVNTLNNHVFMLNEFDPGLLLEFHNGLLINSFELDFAKDYSGLFFDPVSHHLWMVSDESQSIYRCDLEGKLLEIYTHPVDKAEGLVIDVDQNQFWVCSDSQNRLYQLEIKK